MIPDRIVAGAHALLVLGVVLAPALVLRAAGDRGGPEQTGTTDVLAVSAVVGGIAAVLAWRASRPVAGDAPPLPGRWSAGLAALGVLAPLAPALPALGLHTAARLPAEVAAQPWLAPAVWGAGLLLAVLTAAGVQRALLGWLGREPGAPRTGATAVPGADDRRIRSRSA